MQVHIAMSQTGGDWVIEFNLLHVGRLFVCLFVCFCWFVWALSFRVIVIVIVTTHSNILLFFYFVDVG